MSEAHPLGDKTRKIGTLEHFRWLRGIIATVIVLNLLDAIFTMVFVMRRSAVEANPLMADLIASDPRTFMVVKLMLVSGGTFVLWRLRKRPVAVLSIFCAFVAYYLVFLHHLRGLNLNLIERLFG